MVTIPVGFRMDADLVEKLDMIAEDRGLKNRSDIVTIACREFVKRNEGGNRLLVDQIKQALREDPTILDEELQRIGIRFYARKEGDQ